MRSRGRYGLAAALLGAILAVLPAVASSETSPLVTAENIGGLYGEEHRWAPPQITVSTVGGVTLSNPTLVRHGVNWISPPSTPTCDAGVPVGTTEAASATKWSGTCKFTQPGTYTYYCTVHGAAMAGTITVKTPGTPTATTGLPTEKTQTSAKLGGAVKPEGNATSYYFKYGPNPSMEQKIPLSPESAGPTDFAEHAVSATLTALNANTEYHVELVAVYGAGKTEVLGGEHTFTTLAAGAPTVAAGQTTALKETEATLNASVNPNGGGATEYHFDYGTSTSFGQSTEVRSLPADDISHPVSAPLSKLAPATLYYFKLLATNKLGSNSAEGTFTTASAPETTPPTTTTPTAPPSTTTPALTPPPSVTTLAEQPPGPSIVGSPSLATTQHGSSVHGSLQVSQAGVGGSLEVDLLAKNASLAKARGSGSIRVGRLSRASLSAGKLSFTVALNATAKRALKRKHRLPLTVKITLTPTQGHPSSFTRSVTLRA